MKRPSGDRALASGGPAVFPKRCQCSEAQRPGGIENQVEPGVVVAADIGFGQREHGKELDDLVEGTETGAAEDRKCEQGAAAVEHRVMPAEQVAQDERRDRSEEHTSEIQYLMRKQYAVFC